MRESPGGYRGLGSKRNRAVVAYGMGWLIGAGVLAVIGAWRWRLAGRTLERLLAEQSESGALQSLDGPGGR